ncbi:lipid transferase CIDEB isoform X2 [Lepisosteus oculatus]|uniref:lipid transferase CIDEB isoform X2 n=1 Tax=Lepisosteus oculatus TaxID=7918 RepID=UPI0037204450
METLSVTSSLIRSVSRRVWSPPQRPFRVCTHDRTVRKGVTAGTLGELKERAAEVLLLSSLLSLVCEEDGTEVESDDFLSSLQDGVALVALEPGQRWTPSKGALSFSSANHKPRNTKDIARVTFDLYRLSPRDMFGSLSVKATFQGLYSVSADFKCLGPKKVLREVLRLSSTLLQALGHLLMASASLIRRVIEGADQWHDPADLQESWD